MASADSHLSDGSDIDFDSDDLEVDSSSDEEDFIPDRRRQMVPPELIAVLESSHDDGDNDDDFLGFDAEWRKKCFQKNYCCLFNIH